MNYDSIHDFEVALQKLLEEEAPSPSWHRLNWLCDQLGEYLERWLGFGKMERIPITAMIGNKLYFVVVAAINVIVNHLERVKAQPGCPTKEWDEFKNAVEWVHQVADRDELGIVESTFATFSQKISQRVGSK